ncbi:sulfatase [Lignipirellula cremea]|uniref:Choline-sulfatase n=1 Tax=Lignipirellula cremea TaxID=2528010 RepID=A0A518E1F4_9BACT|nr:sulfatase [Lignipirellula cremea]QDU97912.1 Choline-sulfatase [Lignipirellula cremea]
MMLVLLRWLAPVCGLLLLAGSLSAAEPERPNVLFLAIDDLNDWVGPLKGHPQVKTPHLDRLAARGTLFANAHCQAPLCNSSRTSLLTGLRPSTTGVYALAPWFRTVDSLQDRVSLPQHFKANGYNTFSTGKIWHGGYPPRDARDAETDHWGPNASVGATPPKKLIPPTPGGNHTLMDWGTFPHRDEDKGDYKVASWAVEQLEAKPQEPFFMAVGFFLPHVPCFATQEWFDLYPEGETQLPPYQTGDRDDTPEFSWYLHWHLPEPRLSWLQQEHQWKPLVRSYLASISFVDAQVGRVLDALEKSGAADNTIIVLWSDHGYHLGEKDISGKNTLWERSTHVPLIFAGPGVTAGARCTQPAELLDIYPTLIDLCGLPPQPGLEGHSLAPQLKDASTPRPWPAITTHNQNNHGVRSEHWRYIRYADGSEELYDLRTDPNEWTNLAGEKKYAPIIAQHAKFLPQVNTPAVVGSRHRLLEKKGSVWLWEGTPINPAEKWE